MAHYDDRLLALGKQKARKKQLFAQIRSLRQRRLTLLDQVSQLEKSKQKEQADVDRLEGRSLAAFFYNVVGKMDEKLDAERRQAYAARVKFDAAARELAYVEADLRDMEAELESLGACEQHYDALLAEKAEAVKTSGGASAEQILAEETQLMELENQLRELSEAVAAGEAAMKVARQVKESLDDADGYATWDMLGGGMFTDLAKYAHLDDAQEQVEKLQTKLCKFRTELIDVQIQADLQVRIDEFTRFADYFFDNIFTDWTVKDEIDSALTQIEQTIDQIHQVLAQLERERKTAETRRGQCKDRLDRIVLEA